MKIVRMILSILSALPALICCGESCCDGAVEVQTGCVYRVTAYCPCEKCCGRYADGITAAGHRITKGDRFVAAPPEIPFGTMLIVPGYKEGRPVPVLDRGGAIKDSRLDVFFDSHAEALAWGVRYVKVKQIKQTDKGVPCHGRETVSQTFSRKAEHAEHSGTGMPGIYRR